MQCELRQPGFVTAATSSRKDIRDAINHFLKHLGLESTLEALCSVASLALIGNLESARSEVGLHRL